MKITNIKPLYRYKNDNGSISITPTKRNEGDEIYSNRLIADEGYELYHNGENQHCRVLDVKDTSDWTQEEVEEPTEPSKKVK